MKKTTYNKLVKIANEHIPELNNKPGRCWRDYYSLCTMEY